MVGIGVGIILRQFERHFQANEKKWKHVHALTKSVLGNISNFLLCISYVKYWNIDY